MCADELNNNPEQTTPPEASATQSNDMPSTQSPDLHALKSGDSTVPRSPGKRILFVILYLIGVTIFIAFSLELAVRMLKIAPPLRPEVSEMVTDPFIKIKPKPGSTISGRHEHDGFQYKYKHNSLGFRDVEHPIEKPEGEFRILGAGDSFMYGSATPFEATILQNLKRELNAREGDHPQVETICGGLPSFYPEPTRHLIQHYGMQFDPDLIIVNFFWNDVLETWESKNNELSVENGWLTTRHAKRLGPISIWLYKHSHVARIVIRSYLAKWDKTYLGKLRPDEVFKDDGMYEKQWQEIFNEYEKIKKMGDEAGAPLVIIYIPRWDYIDPKNDYPVQRLAEWCEENDVLLVNTLAAIRAAGEKTDEALYWKYDTHTTPLGYKIITDVLFKALIKNNLVD
jgi:hypothetical protein